ncbi:DUF4442 domain-containing protein [Haloflavibacter putidus]|uniref:DUF4442 domain-containing protein n=1 Tax=Haloflavibacter putidus TaxID=2576776 RepID=A0A507ZPE7_9FLAO|nr:DUF4442 domain-containing protein [Haloflavibacter putidus]TQD39430.1 DUF4442 domain-containing protein [Haloflavibacter putidus]
MKTQLNPRKINTFLFFKLPSAFWCGVRVKEISTKHCKVGVKYSWFTKNPFKSLYFAVQAMAAELTTGSLVMQAIQETQASVSMLVVGQKASFFKKATGKVYFVCNKGSFIKECINKTVQNNEAQRFWLEVNGVDKQGDTVATFSFEWSVKLKSKN